MSESLEILGRMQQGDRGAVGELLERNLLGLQSYVRLRGGPLLRSREASVDLVQSVCREVLENLDRFQYPSEGGFRRWLYATALRKIRKRHQYWLAQRRETGRELPLDATPLDDHATLLTPSRVVQTREEIEHIEAAFDRLPADYRRAILMARVQCLSRQEMAAKLGRNEGAVRMLLSRAQARLAELLDEDETD